MRFVDEYRDPTTARALVARITELAGDQEFKFMEVCGGHTHTIYRHGIEHVLPPSVELVHGPGCPVCVIPMGRVDDAICVAKEPGVIFTSFGDMMRVPGGQGNLLKAKAEGADVRFVYSPLDALRIATDNPGRQVVFFAVGFETTAPSTALTLLQARSRQIRNFSVFCNHVTIVPPIKAILESPDLRLDGFLGPGHVSTVIGQRPYRFVPDRYHKPVVTAGSSHLTSSRRSPCCLPRSGTGAVRSRTNTHEWCAKRKPPGAERPGRSIRVAAPFRVERIGLHLAERLKLGPALRTSTPSSASRSLTCGWPTPRRASAAEVLKGVIKPWECKVFGTGCTPETPIGTCMVSSEGASAAYYNFGRMHREAAVTLGRKQVLTG